MNIKQYLKKYGNNNFNEVPLNEIDYAIFSLLVYIKYDNNFSRRIILNDLLVNALKKGKNFFKALYGVVPIMDLVQDVSESDRYRNIYVSDYVSDTSVVLEKQFGAITFHINETNHIIVFRGTDKTIIGWKEDFNLSYLKEIPSQRLAKRYLNRLLFKYRGNFTVLGHSKGGNLSIYASCKSFRIFNRKIKKIINFDGPGFDFENVNPKRFIQNESKIINYYPIDSVFGMILENYGQKIFIQNDTFGMFFSHDVRTWHIDDTKFIVDNQTNASKFIHETINQWLKNASYDERKKIVSTIFNLIGVKENKNEVEENNIFKDIIDKYQSLNKDDNKSVILKLNDLIKTSHDVIEKNSKKERGKK